MCGSEQLEGGDELPGAGHLVSPDPSHLVPPRLLSVQALLDLGHDG